MAHVRQSRPDSGLGFELKGFKTFQRSVERRRLGREYLDRPSELTEFPEWEPTIFLGLHREGIWPACCTTGHDKLLSLLSEAVGLNRLKTYRGTSPIRNSAPPRTLQ